jgi:hypothetical protein
MNENRFDFDLIRLIDNNIAFHLSVYIIISIKIVSTTTLTSLVNNKKLHYRNNEFMLSLLSIHYYYVFILSLNKTKYIYIYMELTCGRVRVPSLDIIVVNIVDELYLLLLVGVVELLQQLH